MPLIFNQMLELKNQGNPNNLDKLNKFSTNWKVNSWSKKKY